MGYNHYSLQQFVLRLLENQLPILTQQILHKGSSSGFRLPTSLRYKYVLEAPSTCTTSVQDTPLHREIRQRVSFRPHPRNGLQCATTLKGGCTASFQAIEELVNHLVKKHGNLKNFLGKLDLLVYCPLNGRCPYCKSALIHINSVGKSKLLCSALA